MKNDSAKPMDGDPQRRPDDVVGDRRRGRGLRYLTAREVQQVGAAMASLKQVTRNDVAVVLEEFRQEADQFMAAVTLGSDDTSVPCSQGPGSDRAPA